MNRIIIAALLALGCAGSDTTELASAPPVQQADAPPAVPVGVGEVNGLPGTPLERSANGIPIIEGIERFDYADDGINSFEKRWERRTPENPTGEYRFPMHDAEPTEVLSGDDGSAGFRDGLEEYTWNLTHPDRKKGIFSSAVFHGRAFTTDGNGGIIGLGACWTAQNAGKDCEFPSKKNFTWRLAWGDSGTDANFSRCNQQPPNGTMEPAFYQDPSFWFQEALNVWKPEVNWTHVVSHTEEVTIWCPQSLPGSNFGGVMGSSGGDGATPRRVTNAKDSPGCSSAPAGTAFPKGLYTYGNGNIEYSADNMYQRSILCTSIAQRDDSNLLHNASVNMFAHEIGHVMGFAHFPSGLMQTAGNCGLFYNTLKTLAPAFHQAMAAFSPNSGTFKFIGAEPICGQNTLLPVPSDDNGQYPIGRLQE